MRYLVVTPTEREYRNMTAAIEGKEIVRGPNDVPFGRAAFTFEDGIEVEYIQLAPGRAWFDDEV